MVKERKFCLRLFQMARGGSHLSLLWCVDPSLHPPSPTVTNLKVMKNNGIIAATKRNQYENQKKQRHITPMFFPAQLYEDVVLLPL